ADLDRARHLRRARQPADPGTADSARPRLGIARAKSPPRPDAGGGPAYASKLSRSGRFRHMPRSKGSDELAVDWLTLSFRKDLEDEFRRDYAQKSVPHVRLGIGVAIALWSVFALLDPLMIPEVKEAAWAIRFAFVVPSLLGIFLFTFSGTFYRYSQPAAAA